MLKEEANVDDNPVGRQQHLADYEAREKIQLDWGEIQTNPSPSTVANMMLNSMWGKFGQQTNKTQVVKFCHYQKFLVFSRVTNATSNSWATWPRTASKSTINTKSKTIQCPQISTTSYSALHLLARLCLYDSLDLIQEWVVYFDTDSVVFRTLAKELDPTLGVNLSDFKDKLPDGNHIVQFAFGGPKNYGYLTSMGKEECKIHPPML